MAKGRVDVATESPVHTVPCQQPGWKPPLRRVSPVQIHTPIRAHTHVHTWEGLSLHSKTLGHNFYFLRSCVHTHVRVHRGTGHLYIHTSTHTHAHRCTHTLGLLIPTFTLGPPALVLPCRAHRRFSKTGQTAERSLSNNPSCEEGRQTFLTKDI